MINKSTHEVVKQFIVDAYHHEEHIHENSFFSHQTRIKLKHA